MLYYNHNETSYVITTKKFYVTWKFSCKIVKKFVRKDFFPAIFLSILIGW